MPKQVLREDLVLAGPAGELQALVETPEQVADDAPFAVICHPHPAHGGAMTNKVAHTLARAFNLSGCIAVRFNFRGVGASEGTYDEGRGELDDALAVMDWAMRRWPGRPMMLAGFSFGAAIALRASHKRSARYLVLVAPPVGRIMDAAVRIPAGLATLVVQGGRDELVDAALVLGWVNDQPPGVRMIMLEDADHFFHGQLPTLRGHIVADLEAAQAVAGGA